MSHYNSVVCGPKFTKYFGPTWKGLIVVDDGFFRLSTWRSVLKIIAIKVESCQKSRRIGIFDVFSPSQILGGGPSKNGTHIITPALRHVEWKKLHEDTPTSQEVIVAHTLNFRQNFKFSRLKFLRGPPSQLGCALGSLGQSLTRLKIWGGTTP